MAERQIVPVKRKRSLIPLFLKKNILKDKQKLKEEKKIKKKLVIGILQGIYIICRSW